MFVDIMDTHPDDAREALDIVAEYFFGNVFTHGLIHGGISCRV